MSTLVQHSIPGRVAELDFSMFVPEDFVRPELPPEDVDFSDPSKFVPLALFSSPVALAVIAVAARPAYDDGSLEDWINYTTAQFGLTITGLVSGYTGGMNHTHPCLLVEAEQVQDGTPLTLRIIAVEDGKRFVTIHAMCPTELWPSFRTVFEQSLASFELDSPRGPTVACHPGCMVPIHDAPDAPVGEWPMGRRAWKVDQQVVAARNEEAIGHARILVAQGRFDDAETIVKSADPSIQGFVALARMYEQLLLEAVAANSPSVPTLHKRALDAALACFPEPHTEVEAEQQEEYWAETRARFAEIASGSAR